MVAALPVRKRKKILNAEWHEAEYFLQKSYFSDFNINPTVFDGCLTYSDGLRKAKVGDIRKIVEELLDENNHAKKSGN